MFSLWTSTFTPEAQSLGDPSENDIWICCLIPHVTTADASKEVIIRCRLTRAQLVRGDLVQIRIVRCAVQEILQHNVEGVLEWCHIRAWLSVNDLRDDVVDNDSAHFDAVV